MKPKKNIKIVLIALLLAGVVAGFGYGMTATAKTGEARVAPTAAVSTGSLMVPGNFSDLAEKVRSGVVNIQVSKVVPEGLEDKAGIEQGDVIMNFDGQQVDDSKDLPRIVASTPVGKTVAVKLLRDGKDVERQAKGGEMGRAHPKRLAAPSIILWGYGAESDAAGCAGTRPEEKHRRDCFLS